MRTPWLLVSMLLHGAAVSVALVLGVYAHRQAARPVARIEIRNQPPSAPARTNMRPCPDVEAEDARDASPLVDLDVPPPEPREPEPVIEASPLPATASSMLNQATAERVLRKQVEANEPVVPTEQPVVEKPVEKKPVEQESVPAYTSATRSDRGGPPAYPEKLRRMNREGTVVLRISVAADGTVDEVSLKTPSRYAGFNRAALRAARKWRFDPATENGVAVASETDIEVVFNLTDGQQDRRQPDQP
ncbi:MAG: TonB family protein [Planctomycetota bacterium]